MLADRFEAQWFVHRIGQANFWMRCSFVISHCSSESKAPTRKWCATAGPDGSNKTFSIWSILGWANGLLSSGSMGHASLRVNWLDSTCHIYPYPTHKNGTSSGMVSQNEESSSPLGESEFSAYTSIMDWRRRSTQDFSWWVLQIGRLKKNDRIWWAFHSQRSFRFKQQHQDWSTGKETHFVFQNNTISFFIDLVLSFWFSKQIIFVFSFRSKFHSIALIRSVLLSVYLRNALVLPVIPKASLIRSYWCLL